LAEVEKLVLNKRYMDFMDFFNLDGSAKMKLTRDAAIATCEYASEIGFFVWRIEGGVWHNPGFEARVDSIWDGGFDPGLSALIENNERAVSFLKEEPVEIDAFIVTTTVV